MKSEIHVEVGGNVRGTLVIAQDISGNVITSVGISEIDKLVDDAIKEIEKSNSAIDGKNEAKESIEVIAEEVKREEPQRSLIKTAINGIKAINETVQFGAAVVALIDFAMKFI